MFLVQVPVVNAIFWPVQGFCNFVIFIHPRYSGVRAKYPGRSRLWAFYKVIWNPVESTPHRRTVPVSGSSGGSALRMSLPNMNVEGMDSLEPSDDLDHSDGHENLQARTEIPEVDIINEETDETG
jgi:hypothetical protein